MSQTTAPPSRYISCPIEQEEEVRLSNSPSSLNQIGDCLVYVFVIVLGLIVFGLVLFFALLPVYMVSTALFPGNSFDLEYASVSLKNVTAHDPQKMDSEWFLRFSATNDYFVSNLDYQYINVTLDCLGGTSTIAIIPPFRQKGYSTIYLNATVHAAVPRFNVAGVSLPFNVHIQPSVKYRNWLYSYSHDYTDARCKNMKVDILPSGRHGTMSGPFYCGP